VGPAVASHRQDLLEDDFDPLREGPDGQLHASEFPGEFVLVRTGKDGMRRWGVGIPPPYVADGRILPTIDPN
jgi:hypothetical protein